MLLATTIPPTTYIKAGAGPVTKTVVAHTAQAATKSRDGKAKRSDIERKSDKDRNWRANSERNVYTEAKKAPVEQRSCASSFIGSAVKHSLGDERRWLVLGKSDGFALIVCRQGTITALFREGLNQLLHVGGASQCRRCCHNCGMSRDKEQGQ